MKEVEILVEVFGDKDGVLSILKKFDFKGIKKTADFYFYDPLRTNLKSDATGRLKECFRLRNKNGKYFLTYKVDNFDNTGKWLYSDEHETEISDFECAKKIIEHLGLKPLVTIDNEKHTFVTKEYEIVLEDKIIDA